MKTKQVALAAGISCALGMGALGIGALGVTALPGFADAQNSGGAAQTSGNDMSGLIPYEQNTINVIEQYGPSVVSIEVSAQPDLPGSEDPTAQTPEGLEDFLDQLPPQFREYFEQFQAPGGETPEGEIPDGIPEDLPPQQGSGSGFVIDDAGRIITNYHVVRAALQGGSTELTEGSEITVSFPDSDETYPVRVVGANDFYDLALLELVDPSSKPESVRPIPIADSDALQIGQKAIAIGNPYGFEFSVTTGVVSGVSRSLPGFGDVDVPLVQTDAAINPGNSGGPLLNSAGEVIGVNTAIVPGAGPGFGQAGNIGLGFAVPSNILRDTLPQLAQGGITTLQSRARLGVAIGNVSDYPEVVRNNLDLPEEGVIVQRVEAGSPAEAAGLQGSQFEIMYQDTQIPVGGDIITAVNGEPVTTTRELQQAILSREEGDTVEITYLRDGEEQTTEVTLAVVPQQEQQAPQEAPQEGN
jgi:serine protease Do